MVRSDESGPLFMPAHRRFGHLGLALVLLAHGCARTTHPEQDRATRPRLRDVNVVLITIDTLRADYLSCYGKRGVSTPNIDALAARGVRFAQAIAQVPLTAPSHASILTGSYPQVHKVRDMGGFVLDSKIPTLATILGDAGYETAAFVGAAVLNYHYGMNRGFAQYSDSMKVEKGSEKLQGVVAEVRGEIVKKRALDWIDRYLNKTKNPGPARNFLLWTHYYDPHF